MTIFFLFFRPTDSDGALTPLLWFAVPKPIARARVVRGASLISAFVSRLARNTAFYTVYLFFNLYFYTNGFSTLSVRGPRVGTHNMRVCVSYVSLPSIGVDVPAH